MADLASLRAVIYGRVQGVFFRAFAVQHANRLGLTGYAVNLPDGMVEVQAEGDKAQLEKLLDQLKIGPPHARVDRVEVRWGAFSGDYTVFDIGY